MHDPELPEDADGVFVRAARDGRLLVAYRVGLMGYLHWVDCAELHGDACDGEHCLDELLER